MILDSTPGYALFAGVHVYNEAAFRQFLAADRARAAQLRRCLFLVLASIRHEPGRPLTLSGSLAASLFKGLGSSVREIDFVGWLREDQVAAALLVQGAHAPSRSTSAQIAARIRPAIERRLPGRFAGALRIGVRRLGVWEHD